MSLPAAAAALGAVAGVVIARLVPDETGWYPRWFLGAGSVAGVLAGAFAGWLGVALGGGFAYALTRRNAPAVALAAGGIAVVGNVLSWELLFLAALFSAGYLYSQGLRRQLWWYAAMPALVFASALVS